MQPAAWFFGVVVLSAAGSAFWLAVHSNYGGHHDIYLMLGSFLSVLQQGVYVPSRFTGYPVAEIGIGASAWLGGSGLSNAVNETIFLLSALLFPFCFQTRVALTRYLAFVAITLTSTVMAFDNLMSIDYPWALFFWVLGSLCLRRSRDRIAAVIPMALCIGSRPVFALFVWASILLIDNDVDSAAQTLLSRFRSRWLTLVAITFSGCLFYLPAWLHAAFGLGWISAVGPDNQGVVGLIGRFGIKLILAFGVVQSLILLIVILWMLIAQRCGWRQMFVLREADGRFLAVVILINLIIFARMPVQLSYLQPLLFCSYFGITQLRKPVFLLVATLLASLNLMTWLVQPRLLSIRYQSDRPCSRTVAEGVSLSLGFNQGRYGEFRQKSRNALCFRGWFSEIPGVDGDRVVQGLPLREAITKAHQRSSKE